MAGHRRQIEEYQRQVGQDAMEPLLDAGHVLSEFTAESPRERRLGTCHDDLLGYVIQHSPGLCTWQRTVLTMLHQEARYFWPQLLTKIGNEGYATFWHRQIVQQLPLSGDEIVEVARMNAELVQVRPPQLNPYRLGYILVRRAFDEHGQRGLDWVARHLSDVGLVREYLDAETMERAGLRLITAGTVNETEIPPSVLKAQLLADLEHAGLPRLTVENSETARSGILHLTHHHTGRDLDFAMLKMALALVAKELWPTGVVLKTRYRGVEHRLHHDGRQWKEQLPATTALYMERHQVGN
jgi:stage V sporulation protein R